jgi:hypothetical protein
MEEILASIRRIIADDQPAPAAPAQPVADPPAKAKAAAPSPQPVAPKALVAAVAAPVKDVKRPVPETDDEVLDLGGSGAFSASVLPDDISFADPESEQPEPEPEPVEARAPDPEPVFEMPEPVRMPPVMEATPRPSEAERLLSRQTDAMVANAFQNLANTVLSNNARTLEDIVLDMLKPMIKTWLDDNLPTMVERLVRAEIERVARGGR